ncbi:hypothetical protein AB4144_32005, partial [Rhizobiaceae sp. 2RAB30]
VKALEQGYTQLGQIGATAIQGIAAALEDGKLEGRELLQILFQVAQQLLTMPSAGGGGGIGGLLGGLLGGIPGFAKGTNFAPGGVAMVGERGPELVNLPRGARVIPNHDLSRLRGPSTRPQAPITIRVIGEEGPMFRPAIQAESQDVAVSVSDQRINSYNEQQRRGGLARNQQFYSGLKRRK